MASDEQPQLTTTSVHSIHSNCRQINQARQALTKKSAFEQNAVGLIGGAIQIGGRRLLAI